jgi:hypothetical protein
MHAPRPLTRLLATAGLIVALLAEGTAAASNWTIAAGPGSSAEVQAGTAPTPTDVSATCATPTGTSIQLAWAAVAHASSYTVYQSTTSSSAGFNVVASGVTSPNWTSAPLPAGSYWYELSDTIGANWLSRTSVATTGMVISLAGCA